MIQHSMRHILLALLSAQAGLVWYVVVHWPVLRQFWRQPVKQRKKQSRRSTAPRARTQRPPCPLCQTAEEQPAKPPPSPPPMIEQERSRPRKVDTHNHYCPNEKCPYYGWIGRGNIIANGHPSGGHWRQLYCVACRRYFMETHGTIFYRSPIRAAKILQAIAALADWPTMLLPC